MVYTESKRFIIKRWLHDRGGWQAQNLQPGDLWDELMLQLQSGGGLEAELPLPRGPSVFLRPPTDWMKPPQHYARISA